MKLYRIYTEYNNNLASLIQKHFDSFTIIEGTGFYKGTQEKCAIIEIITKDKRLVDAVKYIIKDVNNQKEVLVYEI